MTADHIWGVFYEGRDIGWIGYESRAESEWELANSDEKHLPAHLARRALGPIEAAQ